MRAILLPVLLTLSACGQNGVPAGYGDRYADCVDYFHGNADGAAYCAAYYQCAAAKVPADQYPEGGLVECAK